MTIGKQDRGFCPVCGKDVAVKNSGTVRRHAGSGPLGDCPGANYPPAMEPPEKTGEPRQEAVPIEPVVGTEMMCLMIRAYVEVPKGTVPREEAQRLYDDPGHLYDTLCAVENENFSLTLTRKRS